ncbi:MAG: HpaII family restriction endonuclease [Bacteroidales bacterium]|nr:HpaII family restriction endonuclease [Bacteroidales bacterium]
MDIWKFNKGEWTEAYVFLKVLGDGRVFGGNAELQQDSLTYIDIINIIRDEPDQYLRFERMMKDELDYIEAYDHKAVFKIVTAKELRDKAKRLYQEIMQLRGNGSGSIPEIEDYLKSLRLTSPKARLSSKAIERYGAKTDLIITTLSSSDHLRMTEGFSIKSHLGAPATLFNSSSTSGFLYCIKGCNEEGMNRINANSLSISKVLKIIREEYELKYMGCRNEIFENNISIVDSRMDEIMQCALLISLGYYEGDDSNQLKTVCKRLVEINPLNHCSPMAYYPYKIKEFLFCSLAGMTATRPWDGLKLLAGGYLDVSPEGRILYYRAVSDNTFGSYLLNNTFFDTPDRGINSSLAIARGKAAMENREPTEDEINRASHTKSGSKKMKKNDWGYVYKKDDKYLLALNFQIRFR